MVSKSYDITTRDGTLAWARTPARPSTGRTRGKTCDAHGGMTRVNTDALEVEMNGVVWAVAPTPAGEDSHTAELHYCPGCLDEEYRTHDRADAPDLELLAEAIADEWTNPHRRGQLDTTLFAVAEVTADAVPLFCPYCSDPLDATDDGAFVCSVHGRLGVDITPAEVPTP